TDADRAAARARAAAGDVHVEAAVATTAADRLRHHRGRITAARVHAVVDDEIDRRRIAAAARAAAKADTHRATARARAAARDVDVEATVAAAATEGLGQNAGGHVAERHHAGRRGRSHRSCGAAAGARTAQSDRYGATARSRAAAAHGHIEAAVAAAA